MASRSQPSLASIKYNLADEILNWATVEGDMLQRTLLHAYLVEALNACDYIGDVKVFLPDGLHSKVPILRKVDGLDAQIDPKVARGIRDRHKEAYGFIQQALLLSMIED